MAGVILAGSKPSAGLLSIQRFEVAANAILNLTTTETDMPGASVSVTAQTGSAFFMATAAFDCQMTASASVTAIGYLSIDGTDQNAQALFNGLTNNFRATVCQTWSGALTAGSHTFKLRGQMASGTGIRFNPSHTHLVVVVFG